MIWTIESPSNRETRSKKAKYINAGKNDLGDFICVDAQIERQTQKGTKALKLATTRKWTSTMKI